MSIQALDVATIRQLLRPARQRSERAPDRPHRRLIVDDIPVVMYGAGSTLRESDLAQIVREARARYMIRKGRM